MKHRSSIVFLLATGAACIFLAGCPSQSGNAVGTVLGTWNGGGSTATIVPMVGVTVTVSNIVCTFATGTFVLTYSAFSLNSTYNAGPSTQAGTISPATPGSDVVITCVTQTGSGFWPGAGTAFYVRIHLISSTSATMEYSSDGSSWNSWGNYTK